MVSLLLALAATALDRPEAQPGTPEADLLMDCRLNRGSEDPQSEPGIPYAVFLTGSRRPGNETEADAPSSMDTYDPERLTAFNRHGAYGVNRAWPDFVRVEFPPNGGRGIHGEHLPPTAWGGVFQTLSIDRNRGEAQVALVQYDDWSDGRRSGPVPVRALYYGRCRILEGESAVATFRTMQP